jgi:hypothetical protein
MHGFVNLFLGVALAREHDLDAATISSILAEEDPGAFTFGEGAARWRDLAVTAAAIASARTTAITSYGSCSFDEPRQDLVALGWMHPSPAVR